MWNFETGMTHFYLGINSSCKIIAKKRLKRITSLTDTIRFQADFEYFQSISLGCDFRFGGIFWIKVQFNFIKALLGHLRGGLIRQIQYLPLPDKLMNLCIHLLWLFYLKLVKFTSNMIDQINELNAKNRTTLTSAVVEKHGVTWFVKTLEAPRYFINKTKNISVTL
jgi:hypothetical protein